MRGAPERVPESTSGARRPARPRLRPRPAHSLPALLAALAALLLSCLAAACGPGRAGAPESAQERPFRVAVGQDLTASGVRQELIREAARDAGARQVEIVELPDDTDRQRGQLVAALQGGDRAGYDLVVLDVTWTAEFAELGLIEPLTGDLDVQRAKQYADVWPAVRETVRHDGRSWGVPWNTDVGLLFYRADLLDADPALRTWQGLTRVVHGQRPGHGLSAGMITQLMTYEGLTVNAHEAVWRDGGDLVDAAGRVRAGESRARQGLGELRAGFTAPPGRLPMFDGGSLVSDETASVERFLAGEALTMRNWPFARFPLEEHLKKVRDGTAYGVTALPAGDPDGDGTGPETGGPAVLGGQNLAVAAGTPNGALAREVIRRLTSKDMAGRLYAKGFVPAHRDAVGAGGCDAGSGSWSLPERPPQEPSLAAQYHEALCWSMEHARARPATPYYAAVTRDIQEVTAQGLAEEAGMDTGELQRRLERSLRGE
ncbi:extracellular solute-binding protein [Streptomyces sp. ODS28]|uniref:extracellular solute-binding protein n=1 Tax=Streptomyces sp. ODS28 TaxID=3136688 RepID=UPI0031EA50A2